MSPYISAPSAPAASSRDSSKPKVGRNARVAKNAKARKFTLPAGYQITPDMIKEQKSTWSPRRKDAPARSKLRRDMRALYWGEGVHEMLIGALMEDTHHAEQYGIISDRWCAEQTLAHATDAIGESHTFGTAGLIAEARDAQRNLLLFPEPTVVVDAADSEGEDALEDAEQRARARRRHKAGDHGSCNPATADMDAADFCDDPDMVDPHDAAERARIEAHLERRRADFAADMARRAERYAREQARRTAEADAAWARDVEEERAAAQAEEHLLLRAPLAEDDQGLRWRQRLARRKAAFLDSRSRRPVRC